MTLRARPVVRKPGRSGWNSDDRRTFLTNLGFVVAIVVSLLILVGYAGYSWYDDHFGMAATVDGTTITKDELRVRYAVEDFRIKYTESRIRTLNLAGRLSDASMSSQLQYLTQLQQSLASVALERTVDTTLQAKLATEEGVTVSDADIDAQLLVEATIDEQRHTWMIEVTPANDPATGKPGDKEKADAKAKADAALKQLTSGTTWEKVAVSVSDSATAAQDGDLNWLPKDSGYDEAFMAAVFAAPLNTPTAVVEGTDGVYRIGRATEVADKTVDDTFQQRITDAGIKTDDYRGVVRADLVRKGLDAKIVADLSKPSLQRHVEQIFMTVGTPMPDGVKVRHILISPNNDPAGAKNLAADDPAWKAAGDEARKLYAEIIADPTKFDVLARKNSDEGNASSTGGKLPYYDRTSPIDLTFANAILAPNLKPGQILGPIKSAFGWHIIQIMRPYGTGEADWMTSLRTSLLAGGSFEQAARDQGEGPEAGVGGDVGWIARGELSDLKEKPIFSASIGGLTEVTTIANEGVYLWKVVGEEMRTPTADQVKTFKDTGFTNWYTLKKADAHITRNTGSTTATQ